MRNINMTTIFINIYTIILVFYFIPAKINIIDLIIQLINHCMFSIININFVF